MLSVLLSALSGILLSGAFEPIGKWWLAPIALAAHMYALTLSKRKILSSFVFALALNAIVLHWSSTFVGSIPWLILAIGMSIFYLPLALVSRWGITAYPLIYIVMEEVRNRIYAQEIGKMLAEPKGAPEIGPGPVAGPACGSKG